MLYNIFNTLTNKQNKTCKAAAILPYTIINGVCYILVAKQIRRKKSLFNFIGGKRMHFSETALNIAKREFIEETTTIYNHNVLPIHIFNQFLMYNPHKVLYCKKIGYTVFPVRLFLTKDEQNYISNSFHKFYEVQSLHWIKLNHLYLSNYRNSCFHQWTADILNKININHLLF